MYFRDGKLISEKSYKASKARTRSTRKGQVRKTARRAYTKTRGRKMRKNFDLNIVDTASAVLIGSALLTTAAGGSGNPIAEAKIGAWEFALKDLATNIRTKAVQNYVAKVAIGTVLAKGAAKALKVRKIGGIKNIFSLTV
jgi:hypothetical protein